MKMDLQLCPKCGCQLSAASRLEKTGTRGAVTLTPKSGDVTVCVGCGAVLTFGRGMKLEPFDIEQLEGNARIVIDKVRNAVLELHKAVLELNIKVDPSRLPS